MGQAGGEKHPAKSVQDRDTWNAGTVRISEPSTCIQYGNVNIGGKGMGKRVMGLILAALLMTGCAAIGPGQAPEGGTPSSRSAGPGTVILLTADP